MYRLKKEGRATVIIPDGFLFGNDNAKSNIKRKLLTDFNLHTVIRMPQSVFAPYTSITTNILFFDNNCNFDVCGYPHEEEEILSLKETIQTYEEKRTALNAGIDKLLSDITALHEKAQKGEL